MDLSRSPTREAHLGWSYPTRGDGSRRDSAANAMEAVCQFEDGCLSLNGSFAGARTDRPRSMPRQGRILAWVFGRTSVRAPVAALGF